MTEYPAVTFMFHTTPEQERTSLRDLELPARAEGVLLRAGLKTVGDIISRWYDLGNVRQKNSKMGLGEISIREVHSKVFAWLCENGCVTKLAMEVPK